MAQPPAELSQRVEVAFKEWTQYWGKGQVVRKAQGRILPAITAEQVENVVRRLRNGKALGPDGWEPNELRALPRRAYAQMAAIMNNAEKEGRWPEQLRVTQVSLIPKEGACHEGKLRPIGVLPYFYRVWMAARGRDAQPW